MQMFESQTTSIFLRQCAVQNDEQNEENSLGHGDWHVQILERNNVEE